MSRYTGRTNRFYTDSHHAIDWDAIEQKAFTLEHRNYKLPQDKPIIRFSRIEHDTPERQQRLVELIAIECADKKISVEQFRDTNKKLPSFAMLRRDIITRALDAGFFPTEIYNTTGFSWGLIYLCKRNKSLSDSVATNNQEKILPLNLSAPNSQPIRITESLLQTP